jgi:hypothetical protein
VEPETKTITVAGKDYTLGVIRTGLGRKLQAHAKGDSSEFSVAFLAASLNAGGHKEATIEWVDENIPFYGAFNELWAAALELNGMKKPTGENRPEPGPAAASTLPTTTLQ